MLSFGKSSSRTPQNKGETQKNTTPPADKTSSISTAQKEGIQKDSSVTRLDRLSRWLIPDDKISNESMKSTVPEVLENDTKSTKSSSDNKETTIPMVPAAMETPPTNKRSSFSSFFQRTSANAIAMASSSTTNDSGSGSRSGLKSHEGDNAMSTMLDPMCERVLEYWFGGDTQINYRTKWFPTGNDTIQRKADDTVMNLFEEVFYLCYLGEKTIEWSKHPRSTLALIIVLDQFSRHIFRRQRVPSHDPRRKQADTSALAAAIQLSSTPHWDRVFSVPEFVFALMPYRHARTVDKLTIVMEEIQRREQEAEDGEKLLGKFRKQTARNLQAAQDRSKSAHIHEDNENNNDDEILERAAFDADETDILKHTLVATTAVFLEQRMQEMRLKDCVLQAFTVPSKRIQKEGKDEKNQSNVGGNKCDGHPESGSKEGSGQRSGQASRLEVTAETNLNLSFNEDDDDDCEMVVPLSPLEAIIHKSNPPSPDTTTIPTSPHLPTSIATHPSSSSSSSAWSKNQNEAVSGPAPVSESDQLAGQDLSPHQLPSLPLHGGDLQGDGEGDEGGDRMSYQGQGYPIVISLSGGVDSMVIAKILVTLRQAQTNHQNHNNSNHSPPSDHQSNHQSNPQTSLRAAGNSHRNSSIHSSPHHHAVNTLLTLPIGPIVAVHIDYANREESGREAQFVQRWCEEMGIVFHYRVVGEVTRGITERDEYEKVAREIRYSYYKTVLTSLDVYPIGGVLFGHHLGDVQENVISNVMRGCSPLALSGMTAIGISNGVAVWRPLLTHPKSEIFDFAHRYGVPYFKDTTPSWSTRGKLRNHLVPLLVDMYGEGCLRNLSNLAKESDDTLSFVSTNLYRPFVRAIKCYPCGLIVDIKPYMSQPLCFWREMLKEMMHAMKMCMVRERSVKSLLDRFPLFTFPLKDATWLELRKGFHTLLTPNGHLVVFRDGILMPTVGNTTTPMRGEGDDGDISGWGGDSGDVTNEASIRWLDYSHVRVSVQDVIGPTTTTTTIATSGGSGDAITTIAGSSSGTANSSASVDSSLGVVRGVLSSVNHPPQPYTLTFGPWKCIIASVSSLHKNKSLMQDPLALGGDNNDSNVDVDDDTDDDDGIVATFGANAIQANKLIRGVLKGQFSYVMDVPVGCTCLGIWGNHVEKDKGKGEGRGSGGGSGGGGKGKTGKTINARLRRKLAREDGGGGGGSVVVLGSGIGSSKDGCEEGDGSLAVDDDNIDSSTIINFDSYPLSHPHPDNNNNNNNDNNNNNNDTDNLPSADIDITLVSNTTTPTLCNHISPSLDPPSLISSPVPALQGLDTRFRQGLPLLVPLVSVVSPVSDSEGNIVSDVDDGGGADKNKNKNKSSLQQSSEEYVLLEDPSFSFSSPPSSPSSLLLRLRVQYVYMGHREVHLPSYAM